MKYFTLLFLLSTIQGYAQDCLLRGRIIDLNNPKDSSCKIVFIQNHVRMDSSFADSEGNFSASMPSGHYDIELSRNFSKPVTFRKILLNSGLQTIHFNTRFIYRPPADMRQYYLSQRPAWESDPAKHVTVFYIFPPPPPNPIVCPAFLHAQGSDDVASITDTSALVDTAFARQDAMEVVGNETWHMRYLPNPARNSARIDFSEKVQHVRITDKRGKVVNEVYGEGLLYIDIDVSMWPRGIYKIHVSHNMQTLTGKITVIH